MPRVRSWLVLSACGLLLAPALPLAPAWASSGACASTCGASGAQRWMAAYQYQPAPSTLLSTHGEAVAAAGECGSYVSGFVNDPSTFTDVFLSRFHCDGVDALGNPGPLWATTFSLPYREEVYDMASIVGPASDDVYLAGGVSLASSSQMDVLVMRYQATATGAVLLCTAPLSGPPTWDMAWDVAAAPDGTGVYVVGLRGGLPFLSFYDALCAERWTVTWASNYWPEGVSALLNGPNVDIYVAGSKDYTTLPDVFLRKYACPAPCTTTGPSPTPAWETLWGTAAGYDVAHDVAVYSTPTAEGAYVAGETRHPRAVLLRFDNAGNLVWARDNDFTSQAVAFGVSVRQAGGAFLVGERDALAGNQRDAFVAAYDLGTASGTTLDWSYDLIGGTGLDRGTAVATSQDGDALVSIRGTGWPVANGMPQVAHFRWCD